MAAKLIMPKKVRGVRKEMECNALRNYPGRKGCGARFTFVPSDTRELTIHGNYQDAGRPGTGFKVAPVERYVTCPKCRGACFVETVRAGVKYNRRERELLEGQADIGGRG